jgi:hypothetical protein
MAAEVRFRAEILGQPDALLRLLEDALSGAATVTLPA